MSELVILCKSANGKSVVYNPDDSHTSTHFKDAPSLKDVVVEILTKRKLDGVLVGENVDLGRIVGNTDVIEVNSSDEIVYAMRQKREDQGYVPFAKNREPQPTSLVSIYLIQKDEDTYELSSAWFGEFDSPNFPQMKNTDPDSITYWQQHAFVWGSQEIIPGSERADCPW